MKSTRKSTGHRLLLFIVRAAVCLLILMLSQLTTNTEQKLHNEARRVRRDVPFIADASTTNVTTAAPYCVSPSIEEFPPDFLTMQQRKYGGVVIHVTIILYLLAVLSIVCDDYFVTALYKICNKLNMSSDVAGATFMAAGTSAPELFTSVISVFVTQSDIGLGTVVGSVAFNSLFIVSACALAAQTVIQLNWYSLTRDCIYYLLSALAIIVVIVDGKVEWYEGLLILILYAIYIGIMYFNSRIESLANRLVLPREATIGGVEVYPFSSLEERQPDVQANEETVTSRSPLGVGTSASIEEDDDNDESIFDIPKSIPKQIFWAILMPANLLLFITIPDCRRHRFRRFYALTFVMSLLWIAASSYVIVWMVCIVGYTAGVPDSVMGLTLLAAGTSLPKLIACVIVTRAGEGDMAISGLIGSNVFDLLFCLGFPWFVSSVIVRPGVPVHINSAGLTYSSAMLFSTVILLLLGTRLNGWKLNKKYGSILLVIWFIVTVLMCLFEMNVFRNFRPPTCASN